MKKSFVLIAVIAALFAALLLMGCENTADDSGTDTLPSLTIKNESSFTLKDVTFSGVSFTAPDSTELPPTSQAVNRLTKNELNNAGYITFTRKDIGIACRTDAVTQVFDKDITVTITDTTLVVETANTDNKKPLGQISFISKLDIEWGGLTVAKNDTVNLGEATLNQTLESIFSIKNTGVGKLLLNGTEPVKITPPVEGFTVVQPASSEVLPNGTLAFKINFRPTVEKTYNGAVTIDSNDPAGNFSFTINAGGVPPKPIAAIFYGDEEIAQNGTITAESTLMTQSSSITITIKNIGSEVLTIDTANIAISGTNSSSFSKQSSPGDSISAGGQSQFIVQFAPMSAGEHNALLTIPCNDSSRNPINVFLQGTATQGAAVLELSQGTTLITSNAITPWDFGPVELETNKTVVFTIKNTGNIPLHLTGNPAIESSSSVFTVSTQPARTEIPAGDNVFFVVRYAPTEETVSTADITIMDNTAEEMFTLKVMGNGYMKKPIAAILYGDEEIAQNGTITAESTLMTQSSSITITIKNIGSEVLTIDTANIAISGTNSSSFSKQSSPGGSISAGGQSQFIVQFAPMSAGEHNALLTIPCNDSSRNLINVFLQGTATQGAAVLELRQGTTLITSNAITPWDFGPVELETNKTVVFTIKNTGNMPLRLTGNPAVESSSSIFTIPTQPARTEIPAGDSVFFVIRYAPTEETVSTADITIMDNVAEGMFTLKVTGNGHIKKPQISLRQNTAAISANDYFSIGTIRTGRTEERVFTIMNTGDANLTFDTTAGNRVNLAENTGGVVTITTQPSSASVSPKGTTSFTLRFAPTTVGDFSAKVQINTNSRTDGDFSFTVNGAGGYTIIFNAAGGMFRDGTTSKTLAVAPGGDVRFSDAGIPKQSGYAFDKWYDGTNYYDGTTPFGPVSSDITYTAQWKEEEASVAPSLAWSGDWTRISENKYTSNAIGASANTIERLNIVALNACTVTIQITASSSGWDYGYASRLDTGVSTSRYQMQVSGTQVATYTYYIPSGSHYIQFMYQKMDHGSSGSDSVTVEVISIDY